MTERNITPSMRQKLLNYFVNQYQQYRDAVLSGKRISGTLEREMVERPERDLKRKLHWRFDFVEATRPLI